MFSHLELLLFFSVSVNILMETWISTLETKIGSKMISDKYKSAAGTTE